MLQPFKHRFGPLDWAAALSAERTARTLRAASATVYLLLSLLAAMQLLNPGALQRVAAQSAGAVLLVALAGLLLLLAAGAVGSAALQPPGAVLHPGAGDGLLHFAVAMAGLDLAVGHSLLSDTTASIVIGGLGLVLLGCGMALLLSGALPGRSDKETAQDRRLDALERRDQIVRGLVLAVLGAFVFDAAICRVPGGFVGLARTPLGLALLAATCAALLVYGLHALWLLREEGRLWQT